MRLKSWSQVVTLSFAIRFLAVMLARPPATDLRGGKASAASRTSVTAVSMVAEVVSLLGTSPLIRFGIGIVKRRFGFGTPMDVVVTSAADAATSVPTVFAVPRAVRRVHIFHFLFFP
ncbi:hypothetical protein BKA62DRAFT_710354 [Auriculariales sp. MPI-PUGE-AT-0066]|nr:hypothetical protein BKA62DRAFT_710354 [Auriculariales sp. MPI-PUGE-AT-0066]